MFFSLLLFLSFELYASDKRLADLARDPQWLRSLHYKDGWFSQRAGTEVKGFYLSERSDSHSELLANLHEANQNPSYQCLFPFRAKLLERAGLWQRRKIDCTAQLKWKGVFSTDRLSLAFASQYLSNPASVFGHTFLVLSPERKSSSPHPRYLDLTISYAAEVGTKVGALEYAYKGLGGGFKGRFYTEPLYQRIREYSRMEMRDLWFYPLKASPSQIDDLLDHIFELAQRPYFSYFFLDENCSYMMLEVLEVIFPDKNLTSAFSSYVLPVETIKVLEEAELLESGVLEPSLRSKFLAEYSLLSDEDKTKVNQAISGQEQPRSKKALDTLITYLDKLKIESKGALSKEKIENYQSLLLARSALGPKDDEVLIFSSLDPVLSHDPLTLSYRAGVFSGIGFHEFDFRPAVHELIDPAAGYIKHSEIKLVTPTLRLNNDGALRLQKLVLASAANIVPYQSIDPLWSWKFFLQRSHLQDRLCFDCSVTEFQFALGADFSLHKNLDAYVLPAIKVDWGSDLKENFRGGPGLVSGLIFDFNERWKLNLGSDYLFADRLGHFRDAILKTDVSASYNFSQTFSFRATHIQWRASDNSKPTHESSLSLTGFF